MSRINNTIKNYSANIILLLITTILSFVNRTYFIKILGVSYLGVNGLLSNILSMLSLAELGIGSAISFSLYKPLADNDKNKIRNLMKFYKNIYRIIGIIVIVIGLVLMLFLDFIIPNPGNVENLKLIFLLYIINNGSIYFIAYKNTLLEADQKNYKIFKINAFFNIFIALGQLLILLLTKNYIMYLITNIVISIIQRLIINKKISKLYTYIDEKTDEKLDKGELQTIKKNVTAMLFHKIGAYCISGTDNILISMFISITAVGLYSNYFMLITTINNFIVLFFNSMTSSMGNLLAIETTEKKLQTYKLINFISFWMFGFATICFYVLIDPFIKLWLGQKYLLETSVVIVILLNFYITGMRVPTGTVKSSAGLYSQDKYGPLIESMINLVVSIVLVKFIGLVGIFIGTVVSGILVPCWYQPYIIYKYLFKTSVLDYFKDYIKYFVVVIMSALIIRYVLDIFYVSNILAFIIRLGLCIILSNGIFILLFFKSKQFQELFRLVKGLEMWKKFKKKSA